MVTLFVGLLGAVTIYGTLVLTRFFALKLVVDLRKGLYASTKLDIDLNYLPCGKIRTDAGWVTGTIERTDGQLILSEDYAPGEPDALDITSAGQRGPLELRDAEGIVFTPCMVARNLDMDALGEL